MKKDHPYEYVEVDGEPDDIDQAEVDLVWEKDKDWRRTDIRVIKMGDQ